MATSLPDNNPNLPGLVPNGNPVKYAQYLQKQTTGAVKLWKPRYFLVANNTLWYFKDKSTAVVGSEVFRIDLKLCGAGFPGAEGFKLIIGAGDATDGICSSSSSFISLIPSSRQ